MWLQVGDGPGAEIGWQLGRQPGARLSLSKPEGLNIRAQGRVIKPRSNARKASPGFDRPGQASQAFVPGSPTIKAAFGSRDRISVSRIGPRLAAWLAVRKPFRSCAANHVKYYSRR